MTFVNKNDFCYIYLTKLLSLALINESLCLKRKGLGHRKYFQFNFSTLLEYAWVHGLESTISVESVTETRCSIYSRLTYLIPIVIIPALTIARNRPGSRRKVHGSKYL